MFAQIYMDLYTHPWLLLIIEKNSIKAGLEKIVYYLNPKNVHKYLDHLEKDYNHMVMS